MESTENLRSRKPPGERFPMIFSVTSVLSVVQLLNILLMSAE
jgi:hypothetical protein